MSHFQQTQMLMPFELFLDFAWYIVDIKAPYETIVCQIQFFWTNP